MLKLFEESFLFEILDDSTSAGEKTSFVDFLFFIPNLLAKLLDGDKFSLLMVFDLCSFCYLWGDLIV